MDVVGTCERRLSTRWLLETCKVKLIPVVERLQREKDEYLQEAIAALRAEMARLVPAICQQVRVVSGRKAVQSCCRVYAFQWLAGPGFRPGFKSSPMALSQW